jgi:hypothetical protein
LIKPIVGDFYDVKEFDHQCVVKLQDFFDLGFATRDPDQYRQYFQNLKMLAGQNLGLAHCVIHNQSARNVVALAYQHTKLACFDRPYGTNIGAYSFRKPVIDEQLILDGNHIRGVKKWSSQLHHSDFIVLTTINTQEQRSWVFIDLHKVPHRIVNARDTSLGMEIARASDLEIDLELPADWIINNRVPVEHMKKIISFHNYQLNTNYLGGARGLLDLVTELCNSRGYSVGHSIKTLDLQLRVLESLWIKNLDSPLEPLDDQAWSIRDSQYQFGKKTMIDIINFCMQMFNSNMYQAENPKSQLFRDALVLSSHMTNLYRNLDAPEQNEVRKW